MNFISTTLPGVLIIEPKVFQDARGHFFEGYHEKRFADAGISDRFVQDNFSRSLQGSLRGLHHQIDPYAQAKLVRVTYGEIFDVAVDVDPASPTFGQWSGEILSESNKRAMYVPKKYAHGFYVMSAAAEVFYKCSDFYMPEFERAVRWDDPKLSIQWPITSKPILSKKDEQAPFL